jgi:hypothetical protein
MTAYFRHYQSLMAHWRRVCSLPILELPYEGVVAQPEAWSRRLVAFIGLEWDPRCLRFHEAGVATSAGDAPLREPLSDREVGGWRHYERWLRPFGDVLDADGYAPRSA